MNLVISEEQTAEMNKHIQIISGTQSHTATKSGPSDKQNKHTGEEAQQEHFSLNLSTLHDDGRPEKVIKDSTGARIFELAQDGATGTHSPVGLPSLPSNRNLSYNNSSSKFSKPSTAERIAIQNQYPAYQPPSNIDSKIASTPVGELNVTIKEPKFQFAEQLAYLPNSLIREKEEQIQTMVSTLEQSGE